MKKLLFFILPLIFVTGCKEPEPSIRIADNPTQEIKRAADETLVEGGPLQIVTGEPAVAEEKINQDAQPLKDKPGAIAAKLEY